MLPRSLRRALGAAEALVVIATAIGSAPAGAGGAVPTSSAPSKPQVPEPPAHAPWFGPELDWDVDTTASYAAALGGHVSLVGRTYTYPLTAAGQHDLADQGAQAASAGAVAVVTLDPTSIATLTDDDSLAFARELAQVELESGGAYLVRFAPDMNTPSVPWGMQPETFVHQFRSLSDAVHAATRRSEMVWSPSDGAGYPRGARATTSALTYLDTNHDGRLTRDDDPYGPYYPGEDIVDWVGLTVVPGPRFKATPEGRLVSGFPTLAPRKRQSFYGRYARDAGKPVLLVSGRSGPRWARGLLATARTRPRLGAVLWLGATASSRHLAPLRTVVADTPLTLGPLAVPPPPSAAPAPGPPAPTTPTRPTRPTTPTSDAAAPPAVAATGDGHGFVDFLGGVIATLLAGLVAAVVALRVRQRRAVPTWLR